MLRYIAASAIFAGHFTFMKKCNKICDTYLVINDTSLLYLLRHSISLAPMIGGQIEFEHKSRRIGKI